MILPSPQGQSSTPSDWYSGDHRFDPQSNHIPFAEIWSWNNFYGHSVPTSDSSRAVVSYCRKYGHLVLVNSLGSLPRNSVDRLTDRLDMTLIVLTGLPENKQKVIINSWRSCLIEVYTVCHFICCFWTLNVKTTLFKFKDNYINVASVWRKHFWKMKFYPGQGKVSEFWKEWEKLRNSWEFQNFPKLNLFWQSPAYMWSLPIWRKPPDMAPPFTPSRRGSKKSRYLWIPIFRFCQKLKLVFRSPQMLALSKFTTGSDTRSLLVFRNR